MSYRRGQSRRSGGGFNWEALSKISGSNADFDGSEGQASSQGGSRLKSRLGQPAPQDQGDAESGGGSPNMGLRLQREVSII